MTGVQTCALPISWNFLNFSSICFDFFSEREQMSLGTEFDFHSASLWNLIKDVKPSDLSVVQRDVPPETVNVMKRTVSGILGLLPSDK